MLIRNGVSLCLCKLYLALKWLNNNYYIIFVYTIKTQAMKVTYLYKSMQVSYTVVKGLNYTLVKQFWISIERSSAEKIGSKRKWGKLESESIVF